MGLLGKILGRSPKSPQPSEEKRQLKAFDAEGRERFIDWDVYRETILPKQFADAGTDPEKLYIAIALALDDEFFAEAIAPARRLLKLDRNAANSSIVLGIALMRSGKLDEAQRVFEEYLRAHGENGLILTNLAKVHSTRGEDQVAEGILWHALEVDPNQENALEWWGGIHSDRSGDVGFLNAMAQVAALAGSYRAQLWIARDHLENDRAEEGLELYRKVLPLLSDDGDALMMLTGDLGNNGRIKEAVLMVRASYRLDHHGPMTGINLVKGLIEMKRFQEAHELIDEIETLQRFELKEYLVELRASIPQARGGA